MPNLLQNKPKKGQTMGLRSTFLSLSTTAAILFSGSSTASTPKLNEEIKAADNAFFSAFNSCDIEKIANLFSKDLEFYHDISGLKGYEENIIATKELCARNLGLTRTLNEDSHRVFPVKNFGAIQVGEHTFCHEVNGVNDCGTFDFTHIWKQTEDGWRLYRVVSYGH